MDNFDDILRKAMEAEQRDDDEDVKQLADDFVGILSMGKMLQASIKRWTTASIIFWTATPGRDLIPGGRRLLCQGPAS